MADAYRTVKNVLIGTTYRDDANPAPWEELLSALQAQFEARNISTPVGIHVTASGSSGIVEFHLKDDPKTGQWNLRGRVGLQAGGSGLTSHFIAGPKIVNREAYSLNPQEIEERVFSLGTPGAGKSAASVLSERLVDALYSGQGRTRGVTTYGKALRAQLDEFGNYDPYPSTAKRYGGNTGGMVPSDPSVTNTAYTRYVQDTLAQAKKEGWSAQRVSEVLVVPSQGGVGRISAEEAVFGGYKRVSGYSVKETMTSFGDVVYEDQGEYFAGYTGKAKNVSKRVENLANVPIEVAGFEHARGFFQTNPKPLEGQPMTHLVMPGAVLGPGEAAANFERFAGKEATAPWSTRSFLKSNSLIRMGTFAPNAWREDPNQAYLSHDTTRLGPTGMKSIQVTGTQIEYPLDWDERKIRKHRGSLQVEYLKELAAGGQNLVDPSTIPYYLGRGSLTGEPQIIAHGNTIIPDLVQTNFGVKEDHIKAYGNLMRIGAGAPMDLTSEGPLPQFNVLGVDRAPDWVVSPKNQIKAEPSYALQAFASLPRDYLNRLFSDVGEMERHGISPADVSAIRSSELFMVSGGYMHPSLVNKLIGLASEKVFGHEYSKEEPWGKVRAEQFVQVSPAIRGGIQTMLDAGEISGQFVERNERTYFYNQADAWMVPKITTVRDLYPGDVTSQTVASGQSSAFVDRERFLTRGVPEERAWNLYHAVAGTMPQESTISIDDIRKAVDIQALTDQELTAFMKSGPYSGNFIDIGGMTLEPGKGAIEVLDSGEVSAYGNQWVRTLREASAVPLGLGVREEGYQLRSLRNTLTTSEDFVSRIHQRGRIARHVTGTVGMGGPGDAIYVGEDVLSRGSGIRDEYDLEQLKFAMSDMGGGPATGSRPPIGELMTALNLRVRPMEDLYPDDPELVQANRNRMVVPQEVMAMGWGDFDRDPFSFEMQMYRNAQKAWQGIRIGNDMRPERFYKFLAQYASGTTRRALMSGKEVPWEMLGQAIHETRFTETAKMFQDLREGTAENFAKAAGRGLAAIGLGEHAERFQGRALGKGKMGFGYVPLESLKQYIMTKETQGLPPDATKDQLRAVEQRVSDKMTPFLGIYQNLLDVGPFRGRKMMALGTEYSKWLKKTKGKESPAEFWTSAVEMEFGDLPKSLAKVSKKTGAVSYVRPGAEYLSGDVAAADAFAEMVIGEEFGDLLGGGSGRNFDLKGSIPIPPEAAATLFGFEGQDAQALENIAFELQSGDEKTVRRALETNERFWQERLSKSSKWDIALGHAALNPLSRGQAGSGTLSTEELMQYSYAAAITKPYMEMLHEVGDVPSMQAAYRGFRSGSLTHHLYEKFQKAARSATNIGNDPTALVSEFTRGLPGANQYAGGPAAFTNELFRRARQTLPPNSSVAFAFGAMQQTVVGGLKGLPSGRRLAVALRGELNEKQWKKLALGGKSSLTTMNPAEYDASSLLQFPGIPQTLDDISRWVGTPFMHKLHALTMEAGSPGLTGQAAINEAKYIRTSLLQKLIDELPEDAQGQIASLVGMKAGGRGFAAMAGLKFDALLQEGVNRTQGTVYTGQYPGSSNVYERPPASVDTFLSGFAKGERGIKRDVLESWYKSLPAGEQDVLQEGVTRVLPAMSSYFSGWDTRPPEIDADALASMFAGSPEPGIWGDDDYDEASVEQTLAQEVSETGQSQAPSSSDQGIPLTQEAQEVPSAELLAAREAMKPMPKTHDALLDRMFFFTRAAREQRDLGNQAEAERLTAEANRIHRAALDAMEPGAKAANARSIAQMARQREEFLGKAKEHEWGGRKGPAQYWRKQADLLSRGIDQIKATEAADLARNVSETGKIEGSGSMTGYTWRPFHENLGGPISGLLFRSKHSGPMYSSEEGPEHVSRPPRPNLDPEDINALLDEAARADRQASAPPAYSKEEDESDTRALEYANRKQKEAEEYYRTHGRSGSPEDWARLGTDAGKSTRSKSVKTKSSKPLGNQVDASRRRRNTGVIDLDTGEITNVPPASSDEYWHERLEGLRGLGNLAQEAGEESTSSTEMQTRVADAIEPFLIEAAHQKARTAVGESGDPQSYAENFLLAYNSGVYKVKSGGAKGIQKNPGLDALHDIRQLGDTLTHRGKEAAKRYLTSRGYSEREASDMLQGYGSTKAAALTIEGKNADDAATQLDAQAAINPAVAAAVRKYGRSAMSQGGLFATSEGAPIEVKIANWKDSTDPIAVAVKAGTLAAQQVLTGSATGSGAAPVPASAAPGAPGGGAPGVPGGGGAVPPGAGAAAAFYAAGAGGVPGGGGGAGRGAAGGGGGAQETMLGDLGFLLFNIRRVSWLTMESVKRSMETYAGVEQKAAQINAMATGEIDRSAPGFRIWENKAAFEKAGLTFGKKAFQMWGGAYSSDVGELLGDVAGGPLGGILAAGLPMAGLAGIGNMIGKTFMKRAGRGGMFEEQAGLISGLTSAVQILPAAVAIGSYQNYLARKSEDIGEIVAGTAANIGGTLLFSSIAKGMLAGTAVSPYLAPITAGAIAIEAISGGMGAVRAWKKQREENYRYFGVEPQEVQSIAVRQSQAQADLLAQYYDKIQAGTMTESDWERVRGAAAEIKGEEYTEKAPVTGAITRYEDLLEKVGSSSVKWYGTDRALELAAGFESAGFGLTGSKQDKALFARAAEFDFATGLGTEGTMRAGLGYLSKLGIAPWEAQAKTVQGNYFQLLQSQSRGVQDLLASTVGASLGKIGIYGAEADHILSSIRKANPEIGEREATLLARQLSVGTQFDWARMFPDKAFIDVATGLQRGQEQSWALQNQIRPLEQAREREKQAFSMQYELPKIQRDTEKQLLQMDLGLIGSRLDITGQRLGIAQQEFQLKYAGAELGFSERRLALSQEQAITGYGWQREDIARSMAHAGTQYGWGREDIALDWTQLGLQMAWGAEDYQRARRRARGEDRRALDRQYQRGLIQQGFQAAQLTRKGERMDTQYGWQMEEFGIQGERAGVQYGWQTEGLKLQSEELELQKSKLAEQIPMMREQLDLAKERLGVSEQLYALEEKYLADEKTYIEELAKQKKRDIEHMDTLLPLQQTLATLAAETEQANTRNIALWQKAISEMAEMLKADGMDWFFEAFEERYRKMMNQPKLNEAPLESNYVNLDALPYVPPNTGAGSGSVVNLNVTITGFSAYEQAQQFVQAVQNAIHVAF